ncbi:unnamed protein product [Aureobasidium mustum]|uniref:F-box domain-containing protein n=1 Tax=Aureobasidium mustum TaxID=2773714 RepID=A0A9N8PI44_9PEZI|nr:unnamed protein product [Aureobasidium mustum]
MATPGQPSMIDPSIPPSDCSCKLTRVPPEVALNIVKNVTSKTDLLNVMVTCKHPKDPAETMLWNVCNTRGYEKLLSLTPIEQKHHKTKVHTLLLDFKDNGLQPKDLELQLPCLRDLSIVHWSHNPVNVQVNVSKLITPNLNHLTIANGSTDNFLPALRQAKHLEVLYLALPVRVNGVDPSQLLSLVRTMPHLTTLDGDLTARMQASAAVLLLGNLPQLKKLSLHVTTALSPGEVYTSAVIAVIRAVGAKIDLSHMWLSFSSVPITIDIKHFEPLKNLVHLELFALAHQFDVHFRVTDDPQPFSSLCPLRVLFLDAMSMTSSDDFECIASNHPDLRELVYKRQLDFSQLSSQFPSLLWMDVSSTDIVLTESNW